MFIYPHVERGYEVEFADKEDAPEPQWRLGKILRVKNHAVDVRVFGPHGDIHKSDVRHIGDPSLLKYPPRGDSGVFRLAKSQLQLNDVLALHQTLMRRMSALEQTFHAIVEPMHTEETIMIPSPSPIPARRQSRSASTQAGV